MGREEVNRLDSILWGSIDIYLLVLSVMNRSEKRRSSAWFADFQYLSLNKDDCSIICTVFTFCLFKSVNIFVIFN